MVYFPFILISCVKNPRYASTVKYTPSEARRKWFRVSLCGYCLMAAGSCGAARFARRPSFEAAGAAGGFARRGRTRGNSRAGGVGFASLVLACFASGRSPAAHSRVDIAPLCSAAPTHSSATPTPPAPLAPAVRPRRMLRPPPPPPPQKGGAAIEASRPALPRRLYICISRFPFVIFVVSICPCLFIFVIFVVSSCDATILQKLLHYCKCELFSLHLYHSHMTEGRGRQRAGCPFFRAPAAGVT